MITYKEFLDQVDIINEEDFNNIIKTLPDEGEKIEIKNLTLYTSDLNDIDEVCLQLLSLYLNGFSVFIDHVNYRNRTIRLSVVKSLEDLEAIKELFSNWTIENYDELVKYTKNKTEAEILCDKIRLIRPLLNTLSLEEVKNIVKTYEQK